MEKERENMTKIFCLHSLKLAEFTWRNLECERGMRLAHLKFYESGEFFKAAMHATDMEASLNWRADAKIDLWQLVSKVVAELHSGDRTTVDGRCLEIDRKDDGYERTPEQSAEFVWEACWFPEIVEETRIAACHCLESIFDNRFPGLTELYSEDLYDG